MDDDGNRSLDFNEFKKGLRDYGLLLEPKVCFSFQSEHKHKILRLMMRMVLNFFSNVCMASYKQSYSFLHLSLILLGGKRAFRSI